MVRVLDRSLLPDSEAPFRDAGRSATLPASPSGAAGGDGLATDLARGLVHFVVGRYAGILLYFPTFFVCLLWVRRWDTEKLLWLAVVFGFALVLEIAVPHNRIGGTHALGNRFFVLLPVALCFVDFLDRRAARLVGSLLLALLAVPILRAPLDHSLTPGRMLLAWPHRLFPFEWPLAENVSYVARFPGLDALTDNQYLWEGSPGGVWTLGGTRAEFALVRRRDQPARVKLWSLLPEARITDGRVTRTLRFDGAAREITLVHPMAVYRNEYGTGGETAVYGLGLETQGVVPASAVGHGSDLRRLGVFVQPLP